MKHNMIMIIGSIIIAAIIAVIFWLKRKRRRELPPLTLRIIIWIRGTIRHIARCVKQRALRPLYRKRLSKALIEIAAEKQPIKLSDLESISSKGITVTPEEETEKELLVLMN